MAVLIVLSERGGAKYVPHRRAIVLPTLTGSHAIFCCRLRYTTDMPFFVYLAKSKKTMKKLLAISCLGLFGLVGAYKANAQLHNMGLQMSMVWPKGGGYTKDFNSLYGGLFYEYRFQGADEDVNEAIDHFGLEFGLQYTEFIFKKSNFDLTNVSGINNFSGFFNYVPNPTNPSSSYIISNQVKSSNKGANFYIAPKYYVTIYPDLVEMYISGRVGFQYLHGSGSLGTVSNVNITTSNNHSNFYYGGSLGVEVKLGTVFVGTNFGVDSNSPQKIMNKQEFFVPNGTSSIKAFTSMDKIWGNLVLEFKVKALLNAKD